MRLEQFETCADCGERPSDVIAYDEIKLVAVGICEPCIAKCMADEDDDWRLTHVEAHH